ncbi:hypothetical protein [uncultured Endozoicomonas sp.]|uniref:hypothetical protein n=1 Tax=uncultured Endozoicomonas sp. TaxID=432652 RepID=UPI002616185D|nr:hypothetical protein [uncultured Endozoicomonas sp.]
MSLGVSTAYNFGVLAARAALNNCHSTFGIYTVTRQCHSDSKKKLPQNLKDESQADKKKLCCMDIKASMSAKSCLITENTASLDKLLDLIGKLSEICLPADTKQAYLELYDAKNLIEDAKKAAVFYKDVRYEEYSIAQKLGILLAQKVSMLEGITAINQARYSLTDMAHDNQFVRNYIREKLKDNSLTNNQRDFLEVLAQQALPEEVKSLMENIHPSSTSELFNKPEPEIDNSHGNQAEIEKKINTHQ